MSKYPDQSEVLSQNRELQAKAGSLRASIASKSGETIPAPVTPQNDCLETNLILKAHVSMVETRLCAIGTAKAAAAATKPRNLTERVLAARGVTKISDLPQHRDLLD